MNRDQARALVARTFTHAFDKAQFREFVINLVNKVDEAKAQSWNSQYVKDAFKPHVQRYERLGTYISPDNAKLDVLVVHLTSESKLERGRTAIRNFVADHLKTRDEKDAALVAFVSPTETQWRFSYVKMEYSTVEKESGKVGVETHLTPARRFSYLVGEGESCHTAQTRFLGLLQQTSIDPKLADIEEAFSVEAVTTEFFKKYAELFGELHKALLKLVKSDTHVRDEFKKKGVNSVDFAKKLMGQIVFLYFLQKKGWLGVPKGQDWGAGPNDFLRRLAKGDYGQFGNFFNEVLEPLFYDTLATDRGHDAWCRRLNCRVPFLNGGLFEPISDYEWRDIDINLPNKLFTNSEYLEEGVVGTGVLDVFDRYNFTVNEAEPLESEVAIDPEMLGKVFENLIEDNRRKGLGAYYTPREIVHYMCQESLINYLDITLNAEKAVIQRAELETFVHLGEQISHYEAVETKYAVKMPKSIEKNAHELDEKLADITICDPAVGSGAFPVGMMTEIVRARSALTPYLIADERTPYHFKRHAIQNCLYGVDIDAGAVEIAKLRLWLSLVVDEEDVQQIKPLPNLDYKIVAGNSLLGVEKNLFNQEQYQRLAELKAKFFDESDRKKKAQFKQEIEELIHQLTNGRQVFDFKIYFSEVFHAKNGFDVTIANPPYLSAMEFKKHFPAEQRKTLNDLFETAHGTYDLYILFIEKGIKLLRDGGTLAFINPNKYLSSKYAVALREFLLREVKLERLVDVSGIRVFKSAAVYPVVSFMSKARPHIVYDVNLLLPKKRDLEGFDFKEFVNYRVASVLLSALPENIWGFLLSNNIDLLMRLMKGTIPLAQVAEINASTTAAEADEYGEYLTQTSSKDAVKVINTGTIDRYATLWGRERMTHGGKRFLKPYLSLTNAHVSERRRKMYKEPKLVFAKMAKECEAFFDRAGEFASLNTNCLYDPKNGTSLAFFAGFCNSRLFMFLYMQFFGALRMSGGYFQFQAPQLRVLPFRQPSKEIEEKVAYLVKQIVDAKGRDPEIQTAAWERQIDELFYVLYEVTNDESQIVETTP
jgi:hypothetical protein